MGEAEQQQTPSEKLLEALQGYVRQVVPAAAEGQPIAAGGEAPNWKDIFLFILFASNLTMIVWSVPEEWLKTSQLEVVQKMIPVIGSGLFTLFAAWYKDKALQWIRSRGFRFAQIPLTALAVTLSVPILPLRVVTHPEDSSLYLDKLDNSHLRDWKKDFRVKLGSHSFFLKHHEDQEQTLTPTFERSWTELVWHSISGEPIELNLVCHYRFYSPQTHGITVDVTRKDGPFSKDFLRDDLLKNGGLQLINDHTLRLNSRGPNDSSEPTQLPAGEYTAIALKEDCTPSPPQIFTVHPARHADRTFWEFPKLTCPQ
jgi:hypothetical protein